MLVFIYDKYSSTCMFSSCLQWAELMCSLTIRKGTKSKQGAGHVWVLADEARDEATVGYLLDLGGWVCHLLRSGVGGGVTCSVTGGGGVPR